MIYLFTALYYEAFHFIDRYNLKKTEESTYFQHFSNETADICLTVTGVGEIAAAAAVSSICTRYQPKPNDFLFNIGICAGITEKEGCFFIHKITEQATGKTFYPDILYRHPFREGSLVTGMVPWNGQSEKVVCPDGTLYDMEAAAIYQAGVHFFGPHRMMFLKVVSDTGEPGKVSKEQVKNLLCQDNIFAFARQFLTLENNNVWQEKPIDQLCTDMHCSKTMADSLRLHIRYLALAGVDYETVIREMYDENLLPCKDKKEGKRCFEEFKGRLF